MSKDRSGIYQILCTVSGKSYVGSSKQIYVRWSQHRSKLRKGAHASPRLQQAWNKHGEAAFAFSVLEECPVDKLFEREQFHIDAKKRDYNSMPKVRVITPEMRQKMAIANAALAAARTHCPRGHEYTPDNVYMGKRLGDKRCKACNRERVAAILARETPEQKAERLRKDSERYYANLEARRAKQNDYAAKNREAKREYDRAYRPIKNARRRAMTAAKQVSTQPTLF